MEPYGYQRKPKAYILLFVNRLGTIQVLKTNHQQAIDLPRKQPRIQVPLPQEVMDQLDDLADADGRPTGNMASMLIQAAIELIDDQGFSLVQGKLRKIAITTDEPTDQV